MAILGIVTKDNKVVTDFIDTIIKKAKDNNLVNNPFNIGVCSFKYKNDVAHVIDITPVYPNFTFIAAAVAVLAYYFLRYWVILLAGVLFIAAGLFWSKHFYYFMFKKGITKAGYKDKIMMIDNKEIIKEGLIYGTDRSLRIPIKAEEAKPREMV